MLAALVLAFAVAPSLQDPVKDGTNWIQKSEALLYTWPRPGAVVRFQVRSDMLDSAIAQMEKDPEVAADPDKGRWVDALKHVTIGGTLDTATGKTSVNVELRYEPSNPKGKAASAKLKATIATMIANAFEGLPLNDPSLLRKGGSVSGAEDRNECVRVTVAGKEEGQRTTIDINRRSSLPESIETKDFSMRLRFVEVFPGRFAPSRLEVRTPAGKESRAEYAYQRVADLAFPSTIKVLQQPQSVTFTFVSVRVEPPSR